jgi:hypothetical protein
MTDSSAAAAGYSNLHNTNHCVATISVLYSAEISGTRQSAVAATTDDLHHTRGHHHHPSFGAANFLIFF